MKKNTVTTKALSMFLTVLMLFTTISVGFIVPEAEITANAAETGETHTVTTVAQLNDAITKANTAGVNKITTIKLGSNITYNGSLASFTEIKTANVVFDFNGYSLLMNYIVSGDYESSQLHVQLPSANQGQKYNNIDTFTNGMFIIRSGSTMQIINSKPGNICNMQVYTDFADNKKNKDLDHQTSSSLIYNEGTLIVGDRDNTSYNDFTLYAHSSCRNTNGNDPYAYGEKSASANSYTITVNSSSAIFKMFGGKVHATGVARARRGTYADILCYALNVNNCYSSEIYGGEINIPKCPVDNNNGISQATEKACEGGTARLAAIRCASPYLYIFDVDCAVQTQAGTDSSKNNDVYTSCIWTTDDANAPYIYGGNFSYSAYRGNNNSTAENHGYIVRGAFKLASNGTLNPTAVSDRDYGKNDAGKGKTATGSVKPYTVFIGDGEIVNNEIDDGTAENGINMFSYDTFRQYLAQYGTALDVYYGNSIMTTSGTATQEVGSTNYLRNGYTHSGWMGKTHPGAAYNSSYNTPAAAGLSTEGGSLFLAPVWTENVYTITYDFNDNDGLSKVKDSSNCPINYKITDKKALNAPVRHGYKFTGWEVTAYEYPTTDSKKPWSLGVYPEGFSLYKRNGHLSLKAQWENILYTAVFNLDGGHISGDYSNIEKNYTVNSTFSFPEGVKKSYYDFTGYYKVTTGGGSWQVGETLYKAGSSTSLGDAENLTYGDVTFTAQYTPTVYTVTYDSDNGSSVDDENAKKYTYESTHGLPPVTKLGYTLVGWEAQSSTDTWVAGKVYPVGPSFTFNKMNGDISLKAIWDPATFKVNIDLEDNELINGIPGDIQLNYSYNKTLVVNNPTKTGYIFKGWVVTSDHETGDVWFKGETFDDGIADGSVTLPANRLSDVTLKPMWETKDYEITFDPNGGQGCANFPYTIEDSFNLPSTTKKGYTFNGWYVSVNDPEGSNWIKLNGEGYAGGEAVRKMYGNITLRADWKKTTYVITLDPTEGGTVNPSVLNYDFESIVDLPMPYKTGFEFKGWVVDYADPSASWIIGDEYNVELPQGQYGNMTLKAQWEHIGYNIHFVSSAGSAPSDLKYYVDSEAFNVPAASSPGYEFLYWNVTTPAGNWEMNEKIYTTTEIINRHGHITLNANFKAIPFTITYKDIDGSTEVVNYDMTTPVNLRLYDREGYTFSGWRVESLTDGAGWSGVYQPGPYTAGERYGNVVLVPVLTPSEYEITFIPDGGTPFANLPYTVESTDTLPVSEKTGYDFVGWKVTAAAGNWTEGEIIAGNTAVTGKYGEVTLTAQWTPKKYTITWITGSGTFVTDGVYDQMPDYSSVNTYKAPDAQFTYSFRGWTPVLSTVKGEATYEAQYDKVLNSYTIVWKYETDETSGVKTEISTYSYGEHPVFNGGVNPEKTSSSDKYYRFIGWVDEYDRMLTPDTFVTGDATYTAVFKEVEAPRTVTWIIDGVSHETKWSVGETPAYVGTPIKADSNGTKYTFSHWSPSVVEVQANTDYTYTAVFTESAQKYTASFDADGGDVGASAEIIYDKTGLTMPVPVKDGYTFLGWRVTSNDGTWTDTDLLTFTTYVGRWGNVSFKAEYAATEYTIKVEADDGTVPEYKYTIESTDTLPAFTKDGFVLSGWMIVSADGNWVAGDTVAADKLLTGMFGNVTIHPLWTARLYKINWVSGDITQTVEFKFGASVVAYPPIAKPGYTAVWDAEIPAVMPAEDLTFNAVYTPIQYYLRFNTAGGSAVENFYYDITSDGTLPVPVREGANFKGWRVSAGTGSWVKNTIYEGGTSLLGHYGNVTLTAVWEIELHTVTWVAGDVTKVTKWYHGATPSFDGIPYKSPDDFHSFEFTGWDKEIVTVTQDVTYTALFKATERLYVVRWNVDGHIVEEKQYKYGETPTFSGSTPARPSTVEFDFSFAGWSPEVSKVTGDITYVAMFDVYTKLQGLRVDKASVFIKIGEEAVVSVIISPDTASNKDVEWFSGDTSVATVDEMGRITAVGAGDTVIRVQSKDGKFRSYCVVSVAPVVSEYIVITANGVSTTRLPGEAVQLYATIQPGNTTNKNIIWSSSDSSIAMVDENGLVVFGEVVGTAVITAKSDGYAVGTIEVTTTKDESQINDAVKTYMVMFAKSTSTYIIAGKTYETVSIVVAEGDTVEFLLTEPHFVTLNGVKTERDVDGVFRIKDIHQNYTVMSVERADVGFEEEPDEEPTQKLSFFDKLKEFFRSIVEFFRNLFN